MRRELITTQKWEIIRKWKTAKIQDKSGSFYQSNPIIQPVKTVLLPNNTGKPMQNNQSLFLFSRSKSMQMVGLSSFSTLLIRSKRKAWKQEPFWKQVGTGISKGNWKKTKKLKITILTVAHFHYVDNWGVFSNFKLFYWFTGPISTFTHWPVQRVCPRVLRQSIC